MSEGKSKEKEIEKLRTELRRSLSVVKVKKAHKKIEDVEKLRKKDSILSIIDRLSLNSKINQSVLNNVDKLAKKMPMEMVTRKVPNFESAGLNNLVNTFDSLRYDFQESCDIKSEDFQKLFPRPTLDFSSINAMMSSLSFMCIQMDDMKAYCKRLV